MWGWRYGKSNILSQQCYANRFFWVLSTFRYHALFNCSDKHPRTLSLTHRTLDFVEVNKPHHLLLVLVIVLGDHFSSSHYLERLPAIDIIKTLQLPRGQAALKKTCPWLACQLQYKCLRNHTYPYIKLKHFHTEVRSHRFGCAIKTDPVLEKEFPRLLCLQPYNEKLEAHVNIHTVVIPYM